MLFSELYKIMMNKVTFVGFRGGDRPNLPPWFKYCLQEHNQEQNAGSFSNLHYVILFAFSVSSPFFYFFHVHIPFFGMKLHSKLINNFFELFYFYSI